MKSIYIIKSDTWIRNNRKSWRHGSLYSHIVIWEEHIINPLIPGRALCGKRWDHYFKAPRFDKPQVDEVKECRHCKIRLLK